MRLGLLLAFIIAEDVLVYLGWEFEALVDVTGVRFFGIRADREDLLLLPFQNPFPPRRAIVLALYLEIERTGLVIRDTRVVLKEGG